MGLAQPSTHAELVAAFLHANNLEDQLSEKLWREQWHLWSAHTSWNASVRAASWHDFTTSMKLRAPG